MKKKVLSVLMVFMMCLGLAGCGGGSNSASDDISGKVSLNGSTSMEKFVNALSEGIKEKYPNLQLEAQFTGSGAGLEAVASKTTDIGDSSRALTDEEKAKGLITASAGNHAQGVALAAARQGVKATIVMPTTTPLLKVNRTKDLGAEVILHGDVYDEACAHALDLAAEHGYTFVHPFDDPTVATGQGTIAMDIFKELPTVDYILVPIGGGGLATGVSTLAKLLNPKIKVIGVEPAGAACMKASLEAGKVVSCDHVSTIADGTAVQTPGKIIFPYIQENLDDVITVEDEELIPCFLDLLENHKMLAENSGLLTIAALKHLDVKNKKVVSIISGGNMDVITIASLVQHGLIMRDRIFTVSVFLPDKPGELNKVSDVIADAQGNIIKLEHNQFVSINRNSAVELTITMEAFGTEHKNKIIKSLKKAGYDPKMRNSTSVY